MLAGGEGLEPPQANPESAVLPLDEPPIFNERYVTIPWEFRQIHEAESLSSISIALRMRSSTFSLPMIIILSKSGGLTF